MLLVMVRSTSLSRAPRECEKQQWIDDPTFAFSHEWGLGARGWGLGMCSFRSELVFGHAIDWFGFTVAVDAYGKPNERYVANVDVAFLRLEFGGHEFETSGAQIGFQLLELIVVLLLDAALLFGPLPVATWHSIA